MQERNYPRAPKVKHVAKTAHVPGLPASETAAVASPGALSSPSPRQSNTSIHSPRSMVQPTFSKLPLKENYWLQTYSGSNYMFLSLVRLLFLQPPAWWEYRNLLYY